VAAGKKGRRKKALKRGDVYWTISSKISGAQQDSPTEPRKQKNRRGWLKTEKQKNEMQMVHLGLGFQMGATC